MKTMDRWVQRDMGTAEEWVMAGGRIGPRSPNKPPDNIHGSQCWGGNSGLPFPQAPQISFICREGLSVASTPELQGSVSTQEDSAG